MLNMKIKPLLHQRSKYDGRDVGIDKERWMVESAVDNILYTSSVFLLIKIGKKMSVQV